MRQWQIEKGGENGNKSLRNENLKMDGKCDFRLNRVRNECARESLKVTVIAEKMKTVMQGTD